MTGNQNSFTLNYKNYHVDDERGNCLIKIFPYLKYESSCLYGLRLMFLDINLKTDKHLHKGKSL